MENKKKAPFTLSGIIKNYWTYVILAFFAAGVIFIGWQVLVAGLIVAVAFYAFTQFLYWRRRKKLQKEITIREGDIVAFIATDEQIGLDENLKKLSKSRLYVIQEIKFLYTYAEVTLGGVSGKFNAVYFKKSPKNQFYE